MLSVLQSATCPAVYLQKYPKMTKPQIQRLFIFIQPQSKHVKIIHLSLVITYVLIWHLLVSAVTASQEDFLVIIYTQSCFTNFNYKDIDYQKKCNKRPHIYFKWLSQIGTTHLPQIHYFHLTLSEVKFSFKQLHTRLHLQSPRANALEIRHLCFHDFFFVSNS